MSADRPEKKPERAFYGRRRGKPLRSDQARTSHEILSRLRLDVDAQVPSPLASIFPVPVERIRLEIGCGGGEHLLHRAAQYPATGFIGVEPFVNSMGKLCSALSDGKHPNIRLYDDDAIQLLDWLPDSCLDQIDLLYPDPWPKRRHWKRRFVSKVNLDRFARVLKPNGLLLFASDVDSYVNWTLAACRDHPDFSWQAEGPDDWLMSYEGWPGTRYEAKAMKAGRRPAYLRFLRSG